MTQVQLVNDDYQPLVVDIEKYFGQSQVVLQDARNLIKEIEFNAQRLVVKSFKVPHLLNRFSYSYLKKSKARRSYEFALKIKQFTPKPIAYIEHRMNALLTKSYFICEQFEHDFNMQAPLFNNHPDKQTIFKQFAQFVYALHEQNIMHRDLSPGNILIKANKHKYQFKIVDINRMVFKTLNIKERAKNFNKLWASDKDLSMILQTYATLAGLDQRFINLGMSYNQANKKAKTRKRKLKKFIGLC